jgi:hypothetical protein
VIQIGWFSQNCFIIFFFESVLFYFKSSRILLHDKTDFFSPGSFEGFLQGKPFKSVRRHCFVIRLTLL